MAAVDIPVFLRPTVLRWLDSLYKIEWRFMGCLLLILIGVSPRIGIVVIWLFGDLVERAFNDGVIIPILGIIFLPWTTAFYVLGYAIGDGAAPWGILGIFIGLFMDIALHAGTAVKARR